MVDQSKLTLFIFRLILLMFVGSNSIPLVRLVLGDGSSVVDLLLFLPYSFSKNECQSLPKALMEDLRTAFDDTIRHV
jgi:hypothetical protein